MPHAEADGERAGGVEFGAGKGRADGGGRDDVLGAERAHRGGEQEGRVGAAGERDEERAHLAEPGVERGEPIVQIRHGIVRRIRTAAHAAPKPLSMPTTVTPGLHEAIMPSSAVTPSSPAP